eukprot:4929499-Amphidinium_carterae.1
MVRLGIKSVRGGTTYCRMTKILSYWLPSLWCSSDKTVSKTLSPDNHRKEVLIDGMLQLVAN